MKDYALGDWQTPLALAHEAVSALRRHGFSWSRVLEPTCGVGNFVDAVLTDPPAEEVVGVDIQPDYIDAARQRFSTRGTVTPRFHESDIFTLDLTRDLAWSTGGPLLVLGNPPWVTSAGIGAWGSEQRPPTSHTHGLSGLDAITGAANFDVTEFITMKLLTELPHDDLVVALLMKTGVARRVLTRARKLGLPITRAMIMRIDARASFGAAVDACLCIVQLCSSSFNPESPRIPVYESLRANRPATHMGFAGGELVPDIDTYQQVSWADGASPMKWRQGIKHDAAAVVELVLRDGQLRNRQGDVVDVEPEWVYPLVKGSMLFKGDVVDVPLRTIVTQSSLSEDTGEIVDHAPRLWAYLERHARAFDRRKSRIYRNRSRYAMFGIGGYSFSEFKAAISGFHKVPRVRLVPPTNGRPVMLDDTCYFAESTGPAEAAIVTALLNSQPAVALLRALMFTDAKRPVTSRLLQRLDLSALVDTLDQHAVLEEADSLLARAGVRGVTVSARDLGAFRRPSRQMSMQGLG